MYRIGVDLGGTKTEAVLLDDDGMHILSRKRIPTPAAGGYGDVLGAVAGLVAELRGDRECTIGLCAPGTVSGETGLVGNSNTQCLMGMPLQKDLEAILGGPVSVENDANCFALAEASIGAARHYGVVFGVIMGTGVGGGIVVDGRIHRGRLGIAGEWGHHLLYRDGNPCYCGRRGCVETYISGPALERRWFQLTGRKQWLRDIVQESGAQAARWREGFLDDFGTALANVIDILDPDAVVLGGGVSNVPFLYGAGRDAVHDRVFSDAVDTPILQNRLGDSAGVVGACML